MTSSSLPRSLGYAKLVEMIGKILVTNDDGILAEGLWILAGELNKVAPVIVVAPDREQSAVGTAVTLSQPLRAQKVRPLVPDIEAYSVEGTPADSVILALEKLAGNEVALVVSGINNGLNVGSDVFISGTVGAALQGYLRGLPALAVSISPGDSQHLGDAARLAALLAAKINSSTLPQNTFLNINFPGLSVDNIGGIKTTRLANHSHIETVSEGHDGKRKYYWLVRQRANEKHHDEMTDIWAIDQGHISITPLHTYPHNGSSSGFTDGLCSEIFGRLQKNEV
ncbi:MAG: 5'/3'-nucleotidase SurE [Chloroflexota bacterium]